MPNLACLPVELLLPTIAHLSWRDHRSSRPSVAALCLVNRRIGAVATWVLYHTIMVTENNQYALGDVARQDPSPLNVTRRVFFDISVRRGHDLDAIVSALHQVQEYTGPYEGFVTLQYRFASIKGVRWEFSAYITEDRMPGDIFGLHVAFLASHVRIALHVLWAAKSSNVELINVRSSCTQYLIVDLHGSSFLDNMPALLRKLSILLRIPTLKSLLIRPRMDEFGVSNPALVRFLEEWAFEAREDRVWLDTAIVDDSQEEWPTLQGGFGMWLKGRQLYRSGHSAERVKGVQQADDDGASTCQ
ncbi:hypothetical protein EXIGLDRAFT_699081 [Exidia glandulosa HHB12029]|uniref:F-box domain-containing protein n=1 Tax=Exidia glandulosa HHB12029 TaxID=1314781 RepID=A0A165DYR6_EXIGL|nr:hypothetical protein EXIGLDRAFT_699081 [Exidia glandulosa HHB12029]